MNIRIGVRYTPQLEALLPNNIINGIYANHKYTPSGKLVVIEEKYLIQFDYSGFYRFYHRLEG